jgi:hypothetical protein
LILRNWHMDVRENQGTLGGKSIVFLDILHL